MTFYLSLSTATYKRVEPYQEAYLIDLFTSAQDF